MFDINNAYISSEDSVVIEDSERGYYMFFPSTGGIFIESLTDDDEMTLPIEDRNLMSAIRQANDFLDKYLDGDEWFKSSAKKTADFENLKYWIVADGDIREAYSDLQYFYGDVDAPIVKCWLQPIWDTPDQWYAMIFEDGSWLYLDDWANSMDKSYAASLAQNYLRGMFPTGTHIIQVTWKKRMHADDFNPSGQKLASKKTASMDDDLTWGVVELLSYLDGTPFDSTGRSDDGEAYYNTEREIWTNGNKILHTLQKHESDFPSDLKATYYYVIPELEHYYGDGITASKKTNKKQSNRVAKGKIASRAFSAQEKEEIEKEGEGRIARNRNKLYTTDDPSTLFM